MKIIIHIPIFYLNHHSQCQSPKPKTRNPNIHFPFLYIKANTHILNEFSWSQIPSHYIRLLISIPKFNYLILISMIIIYFIIFACEIKLSMFNTMSKIRMVKILKENIPDKLVSISSYYYPKYNKSLEILAACPLSCTCY